uniref:Aquaporin n=1 Tax=Panagrolaimus sp. PS1159 TaxID=55785 RepID=A0AC35G6G4_9BILA
MRDEKLLLTDTLREKFKIKNKLLKKAIGEIFGTFLLCFIGLSVIAQLILKNEKMNTWIQINVGWGFAVTFSALAVSKVSGGHLNPAVTMLFFTFKIIDFKTMLVYFISQVIGAFLGAAGVYVLYYDLFEAFDGGVRTISGPKGSAAVFTTFSPDWLSPRGAFIDQIVGTGILCLFVVAIIDKKNKIPEYLHCLFFGLVLLMIGCAFGANLGYPINPARDFGPRLFAFIIYGPEVFTYPYPTYWLITIIAPLIGGVLFGWSYYFFSGFHIDEEPVQIIKSEYEPVSTTDIPLKVVKH